LLIAAAAIIFSTMEVALKLVGSSLDPLQITFLRFFIGAIILLPFAIHEYRSKPKGFMTKKLWLSMLLLGAINGPFCMVLFQMGVDNSNASTAAVVFCSNPVFTMIVAHIMTEDEKANRRKVFALMLGLVGLFFMIRPWDIQAGNTMAGVLFSLAAAASFGLYSVVGGKTIKRVGAFTQTASSFFFGSIILLLIMLPLGRPVLTGVADNIGLVLYVSAVVTGCGYLLYFMAMKRSNATTASIIFFLKPVIAPVFAVILLQEAITFNMYIGIALIVAASYILIFRSAKPNAAAS